MYTCVQSLRPVSSPTADMVSDTHAVTTDQKYSRVSYYEYRFVNPTNAKMQ